MAGERTLPIGFTLKPVETKAGGVAYTVEVPQAESIQAVRDFYTAEGKNPDEVILSIWNSGNEQGAKQGQKERVRQAGDDPTKLAEAIADHQASAKVFIQGAPRGGGGGGTTHPSGLTQKQRVALGNAVAMEMATSGSAPTEGRMDEICGELGIDPKHLAA